MTSPYEDAVRFLKDELYATRRVIIHLMPETIQQLLTGYYSCEYRKDTYQWPDQLADALIEKAEVLPPSIGSFFSDRAYCPLCKRGSLSPYDSGFTVPEGLRRHLLGVGNTNQCSVMKIVLQLAGEHWESKFAASDALEKGKERIRIEERKRTEQLFRIGPTGEPVLIDEALDWDRKPRTAEELVWAEQRLADIRFQASVDGNSKSYVQDRGDCVVFADPRQAGRIKFVAYKKPLPKRVQHNLRVKRSWFDFPDSWKHHIRDKYESLFARSVSL